MGPTKSRQDGCTSKAVATPTATQLDGSLSEAHHLRSYVLRTLDRLDEALLTQVDATLAPEVPR